MIVSLMMVCLTMVRLTMVRLMMVSLMMVGLMIVLLFMTKDHQSSTSYKPALWSSRNFARELDQEPMMI